MIISFLIIISLVVIDQITKYIITCNIPLGESYSIIDGFFYLTYVRNDGAGFSILSGQSWFLITVSLVSLGFFLFLFFKTKIREKKIMAILLSLIIAGTVGNLIDRILYQEVIDFLDFVIFGYDFPVFNVADICLTVGIFVFAFIYLFNDSENKEEKNDEQSIPEN